MLGTAVMLAGICIPSCTCTCMAEAANWAEVMEGALLYMYVFYFNTQTSHTVCHQFPPYLCSVLDPFHCDVMVDV